MQHLPVWQQWSHIVLKWSTTYGCSFKSRFSLKWLGRRRGSRCLNRQRFIFFCFADFIGLRARYLWCRVSGGRRAGQPTHLKLPQIWDCSMFDESLKGIHSSLCLCNPSWSVLSRCCRHVVVSSCHTDNVVMGCKREPTLHCHNSFLFAFYYLLQFRTLYFRTII